MKTYFITTICICLGLVLASIGCETESGWDLENDWRENGITGGTPSEYESWKGVIGLVSLSPQGQHLGICTGTLIHPQVVLTAGHCVKMNGGFFSATYDHTKNPQNLLVKDGAKIGMVGLKGELLSEVEQAIGHPDWQGEINMVSQQDWASEHPTKDFIDLALVHLKTPITKYGTYCIRSDNQLTDGEPGIIVGYGLLGSNRQMSAGVHRWGETTLVDVSSDKNQNYIEIGDPSNTCQGDSGGPLFTKVGENWEITGVTSHGNSAMCLPRKDAFSTNVVKHYEWIDGKVKEWTGDSLADCTLKNGDGERLDEPSSEEDTDLPPEEQDGGASGNEDVSGKSKNGNSSCNLTASLGNREDPSVFSILSNLL